MPLDVNALFLDDLDLLMSDEDDGGEEVDEVSMELELPPHKRSSVKAPPPPHVSLISIFI
ncbi:MAG TPA: hypothetical protein VGO47_14500 [Chlamydiales bacterium]|jgi:hypothetical protein|nr:hypothetical protein [Chlamydiales bacterium]